LLWANPSPSKEAFVAIDLALFVSKRLMPVAAALLVLASVRLVQSLTPSGAAHDGARATTEVRVIIAR